MGSNRTAHGNQTSLGGRITRRRLLGTASALAVAGTQLGSLSRPAVASRQGTQFSGKLRF